MMIRQESDNKTGREDALQRLPVSILSISITMKFQQTVQNT